MKVLRQFLALIFEHKKFWLLPIVLAALLVGALIVLSEASPLSPFIYPLL